MKPRWPISHFDRRPEALPAVGGRGQAFLNSRANVGYPTTQAEETDIDTPEVDPDMRIKKALGSLAPGITHESLDRQIELLDAQIEEDREING